MNELVRNHGSRDILADLAQLSSESLVTLKDTEFEVFLAEVRLAGVKAALKGAQDESKKAKRTHGTASSEERGHE